jgi:hypothetical protein
MRPSKRIPFVGASCFTLLIAPMSMSGATSDTATAPSRWPAEKAWSWPIQPPWLVGSNFLPSTAVCDVEIWQADTFDLMTIEAELALARQTTGQDFPDRPRRLAHRRVVHGTRNEIGVEK